jgi:hypothetical protein
VNPRTIQNALIAIVSLILIGAGVFAVWSYNDAIKKAQERDALKDRVSLLETQQRIIAEEVARRAAFDNTIRTERAKTTQRLENLADEDPTSRDYLREPIPQRVRDAYLAR